MRYDTDYALPAQAPQTGYGSIDDDHDALLNLATGILCVPDTELSAAFDQLQARFAEHFSREDALMDAEDFSSRQCHLDEHAAVLQSFAQVRVLLQEGKFQPARNMATQLIQWLPEHIDALDRQLAKFLFYRQTGGAPILLRR